MGYSNYFTGELHLNCPVDDDTKQALLEVINDDSCDFLRKNGKQLPDYHCPWILSKTDDVLEIEYGESGVRAYGFLEWLTYLFHAILEPHGYKFTEENNIFYDGDDQDDFGIIDVIDGKPVIKYGKRTFKKPKFL